MTQETTTLSESTVTTDTAPEKGGAAPTGKTFTEAEVQELIKERLARQSGSERKKLLAEMEIEDVSADAELLKAAKAKREADKTEVERLAGEADKALKRAEKAETEFATFKTQVETERRSALRDSAIKKALDDAKAKADKVLTLLKGAHTDAVSAVLKDDGTVDEGKVKTLIDTARQDFPEDFGRGGVGVPSMTVGKPPTGEKPQIKTSGRL